MADMEMMYHGRNSQLDTVFNGDEDELSFERVLREGGSRISTRQSSRRQSKMDNDYVVHHEEFMRVFSGKHNPFPSGRVEPTHDEPGPTANAKGVRRRWGRPAANVGHQLRITARGDAAA